MYHNWLSVRFLPLLLAFFFFFLFSFSQFLNLDVPHDSGCLVSSVPFSLHSLLEMSLIRLQNLLSGQVTANLYP